MTKTAPKTSAGVTPPQFATSDREPVKLTKVVHPDGRIEILIMPTVDEIVPLPEEIGGETAAPAAAICGPPVMGVTNTTPLPAKIYANEAREITGRCSICRSRDSRPGAGYAICTFM